MIYVLLYGVIIGGPLAAFWLGFWARGMWDKDKELRARGVYPPHRADRLAQVDRPLLTQKDWDDLDRLVNGGGQ